MGSLMAGWDSPIQDPKFVEVMRNKSLTKERIEEYWKLKKKTEEEHMKFIASFPNNPDYEVSFTEESTTKDHKRSSSLPIVDKKNGHLMLGKEANDSYLKDLMKRNGWWTRSNWAFLNEPPVIEEEEEEVPKHKYASQHHVASLATTKLPDSRIV